MKGARCPNRKRKRIGVGGGAPGCDGHLRVYISIPASLPAIRRPKASDTLANILPSRYRNGGGMHINNAEIRKAAMSGHLVCDTCGWSLSRMQIRACKTKKGA